MNRSADQSAEARIRQWLAVGSERAPERAVEDTIDRLRATKQPGMIVLRLPVPLAAGVAALALLVGGAGLWIGLGPDGPAATSSPATAGRCSVEMAVGGRWPILVGHGFQPDTDIVLEIDLADGSHGRVTVSERAELHTDGAGRFGFSMFTQSSNFGRNVFTATDGACTATVPHVVTVDQLPAPCPDQQPGAVVPAGTPAYRAVVELDRPANWWHLDEAAGPAVADAAGSADGRWIGNPIALEGEAQSAALFFDGAESYVEVPELRFGEFTLEAWVYLCDVVDNADAIVGNGVEAPSVNFFDERLRLFTGVEDVVIGETAATLRLWQHWALTRDSSGTRIYLNGLLDATGPTWEGAMVVNQIGRGDAGSLRGALDEVALYDRALTTEELSAHAEAGALAP